MSKAMAVIVQLGPASLMWASLAAAQSSNERTFSVLDRGGVCLSTLGESSALATGYVRIQPAAGKTTPSGVAITAAQAFHGAITPREKSYEVVPNTAHNVHQTAEGTALLLAAIRAAGADEPALSEVATQSEVNANNRKGGIHGITKCGNVPGSAPGIQQARLRRCCQCNGTGRYV
ncbi:MAG: hypothetical protein HY646_15805 [Acidobacteria bacterium]|nr:hypothetical protein [Acidobacteriota bacterium]